jgi:hypothetical protein
MKFIRSPPRFAKPKLLPSQLDLALRMGLDYIGIETMMRSGDAAKMNRETGELSKYAQGPNAL